MEAFRAAPAARTLEAFRAAGPLPRPGRCGTDGHTSPLMSPHLAPNAIQKKKTYVANAGEVFFLTRTAIESAQSWNGGLGMYAPVGFCSEFPLVDPS